MKNPHTLSPLICGKLVDNQSRCEHWKSPLDVISLKLKCCPGKYYACFDCHSELNDSNHTVVRYDILMDSEVNVVICGVCNHEMTFGQYNNENLCCPNCSAKFNPLCKLHYNYYFDGYIDECTIKKSGC